MRWMVMWTAAVAGFAPRAIGDVCMIFILAGICALACVPSSEPANQTLEVKT